MAGTAARDTRPPGIAELPTAGAWPRRSTPRPRPLLASLSQKRQSPFNAFDTLPVIQPMQGDDVGPGAPAECPGGPAVQTALAMLDSVLTRFSVSLANISATVPV